MGKTKCISLKFFLTKMVDRHMSRFKSLKLPDKKVSLKILRNPLKRLTLLITEILQAIQY